MFANDEIVLKRILARKKSGNKNDGHKIGLIFEGGGMRGVFSSGVARGLNELGLSDCFDIVYGSSSGSCAAAYLLSGEIADGSAIYYKDLSGFRFIRPWKVSKMMDIDYLGGVFRNGERSLDQKALKASDTLLKIYVSNAVSGAHKCFTNKSNIDMVDLLMASCATPGYYGKTVRLGGADYLDGNVEKKLPVEEAVGDGCTDILIVPTVPSNYRAKSGPLSEILTKFLMRKLTPEFKYAHRNRIGTYNENLDIAFGKKQLDNVNIFTISPNIKNSMGETNYENLKKISDNGASKAINYFRKAGK